MIKIEEVIAYAHKHFELCDVKRKYTGESYIIHPIRVMLLVKKGGHTDKMLSAAILHDSVEDCKTVRILEICRKFGIEVATLVEELTDISRPEDGNRAIRKEIDRKHIAKSSPQAQAIKLADLIDNAQDIVIHDENFARIYLREMHLLLKIIGNVCSLYDLSVKVLNECANRLGVDLPS